ncbi:MAG: AAA family ATPase [Promethearchaeota archaeon]
MPRTHSIDNVDLVLSEPDEIDMEWIGSDELVAQLLAAWTIVDEQDLPLNPRILGKPGIGKTTLAYAAGRRLKKNVWIYQCTMDTRPEDLIVLPVVSGEREITYHASGLVTAMIEGGVCVLDEGNRMPEKSWASLAPLLDKRRYVESVVAGIKIKAHPEFRICCTMNEDASTYDIPEYIQSRLQPKIFVDFPSAEDELEILKFNLPFSDEEVLEYTVNFLQRAHQRDEPFTVRDGINAARYVLKMQRTRNESLEELFEIAFTQVLGEESLRYTRELPEIDDDRVDHDGYSGDDVDQW